VNPTAWHATTIDSSDNVAVVLQPIAPGDEVIVNVGDHVTTVKALEPIALCHKIALTDLRPGDPVIKYGECIGEATQAIARGAAVHIHNLRSRRGRAEPRRT